MESAGLRSLQMQGPALLATHSLTLRSEMKLESRLEPHCRGHLNFSGRQLTAERSSDLGSDRAAFGLLRAGILAQPETGYGILTV